jgi:hypothetical protein
MAQPRPDRVEINAGSVKDDNINNIFTYMRLCCAPHKRIYVATSVMLSCFTKGLLRRDLSFVIDQTKLASAPVFHKADWFDLQRC